ncbi:MAG: DNA-binding response regulator, LuxR family [Myxococcaceae bacterium]|nr:DNA-binding response regulator, LuxR family [Myxococcaceae bacterium]
MSDGPKILGIDPDRAAQLPIAAAFNQAGLFYRFIGEPKKVLTALNQLKPSVLVLFEEIGSELVDAVLDLVSADVAWAHLPIVVIANDVADRTFVLGLRTGVVAVLPRPFDPARHPSGLRHILTELSTRQGSTSGTSDSKQLARLVEHLRKTRRSGALTFDPRTPNEGHATFLLGKLEKATFKKLSGVEALVSMVAQPTAQWSFAEVHGAGGDGAGVVIEVGESDASAEEEVVVGTIEAEITDPFEMPFEATPEPTAPVASMGAQLLLVDDDEGLCKMFSTLFRKHGFTVTSAQDGFEGLEAARTGNFDAVIADLNMPRMDGWGMLRMLRDDFRTREVPVAFLSCHDDYRDGLKAMNAGAQGYFSKGTRMDALVGQVRKLLEPRVKTALQIIEGVDFQCEVGQVGPQWLLAELETRHFDGRIEAKDNFAGYQLYFQGGRCVHATAVAGRYAAEGERAFNAIIGSRNAEGIVRFGAAQTPQTLHFPTREQIARACATLTENEQRMREGLLVSATEIEVNEDLYAIYGKVGPTQWLEVARLICEERVPPREVISRIDTSPIEVEETLKDLLRRGVVTLKRL